MSWEWNFETPYVVLPGVNIGIVRSFFGLVCGGSVDYGAIEIPDSPKLEGKTAIYYQFFWTRSWGQVLLGGHSQIFYRKSLLRKSVNNLDRFSPASIPHNVCSPHHNIKKQTMQQIMGLNISWICANNTTLHYGFNTRYHVTIPEFPSYKIILN